MKYLGVELHGFDRLTKDKDGVALGRYPKEVYDRLKDLSQVSADNAGGGEIRFVSKGEARITLSCVAPPNRGLVSKVQVFYGDYQEREYVLTDNTPMTITAKVPQLLFDSVGKTKQAMSLIVTRLILWNGCFKILGIEGDFLPMEQDMLPKKTLLSYGTSITQGSNATSPMISFVKLTARLLGMDSINLGLAGAAFCDEVITDYIAQRNDWDILTLCISVNMFNQGYSVDEFYQKARYMVEHISSKHPDKNIYCISLFPFFSDLGLENGSAKSVCRPQEYRDALNKIVREVGSARVVFIDGGDLLCGMNNLSCDLLHPGDYGMISIAQKLSAIINNHSSEIKQ